MKCYWLELYDNKNHSVQTRSNRTVRVLMNNRKA